MGIDVTMTQIGTASQMIRPRGIAALIPLFRPPLYFFREAGDLPNKGPLSGGMD